MDMVGTPTGYLSFWDNPRQVAVTCMHAGNDARGGSKRSWQNPAATRDGRCAADLFNGVAAAGHDVGHHALEEIYRGSRARVGRERIFQRLPQQVRIEL